MTFANGAVNFMGNFRLMPSSLGEFVLSMHDETERFNIFSCVEKEPDHMDLIRKKGFYSYYWVHGVNKLDHKGLRDESAFYASRKQDNVLYDNHHSSNIQKETVIDRNYKRAQNVYDTANFMSVNGYHTIAFDHRSSTTSRCICARRR